VFVAAHVAGGFAQVLKREVDGERQFREDFDSSVDDAVRSIRKSKARVREVERENEALRREHEGVSKLAASLEEQLLETTQQWKRTSLDLTKVVSERDTLAAQLAAVQRGGMFEEASEKAEWEYRGGMNSSRRPRRRSEGVVYSVGA
jgi:chromosome segregation ATPase